MGVLSMDNTEIDGQASSRQSGKGRLPTWAKKTINAPGTMASTHKVKSLLRERGLNTVCESAKCPNIGECFERSTATFMILGNVCKRGCAFCSVDGKGALEAVNSNEAREVAKATKELKLKHVVVTSVTRDDLVDGGAMHFADTIRAIRELNKESIVEVLTPDFHGDKSSLSTVVKARPDIFNHNMETVKRLYGIVRPMGDYERSLKVLRFMGEEGLTTKSGFMVGFGESKQEVEVLLEDLFNTGCSAVTIGQYLQPTRTNLEVARYVRPQIFKDYEETAKAIGFDYVYSGPFVRSSYNADGLFNEG